MRCKCVQPNQVVSSFCTEVGAAVLVGAVMLVNMAAQRYLLQTGQRLGAIQSVQTFPFREKLQLVGPSLGRDWAMFDR